MGGKGGAGRREVKGKGEVGGKGGAGRREVKGIGGVGRKGKSANERHRGIGCDLYELTPWDRCNFPVR